MTAYVIGRVRVSDPSWINDYIPNVQALVESHGGRYLVRSPEFDVIESDGEPATVFVVIEFPSKDAANAFYTSAEYQPWLAARKAGSAAELILVDAL